ncbi:MAG TPA: hypothetical protein VI199_14540 [Novosphingobium sp.]
MRYLILSGLLAVALAPAVARADDPNDPAMRSRTARERDRQQIRQMNRNQLAYVQRRDAGYARDWAAWKDSRGDAGSYDRDGYARQRAQYERDMAAWRRQVAACRAGDYSACGE